MATRTATVLAIVTLTLAAGGRAVSQGKALAWEPSGLTVTAAIGTDARYTMRLVASEVVDGAELSVVPSLAGFVSVEPVFIARIEPQAPVEVTIRVAPTLALEPGEYEGALQVRRVSAEPGRRGPVVPGVLPIAVHVIEAQVANVTFFSNLSNPLLLGYRLPQSTDSAIFSGQKNPDGTAPAVEDLFIEHAQGGTTRFRLDSRARPTDVSMPDGTRIRFDWTDEIHAVVSYITADGTAQASVAMEFPLAAHSPDGSSAVTTAGTDSATMSTASATTASTGGTIRIQVSANGQPVMGASVSARVSDALQSFPAPVTEQGAGVYDAPFLNGGAVPPSAVRSTCQSIVGAVVTTCQVLQPISAYMTTAGCYQLGAAFPPAAGIIIPACVATFTAAAAACIVPNAFPEGADEGLCRLISNVVEFLPGHNVIVEASAAKNGFTASAIQPAATDQELVSFNLDLPLPACDIQSFSTSPVDPAPFQSYTAFVTTTCGAPSDSIAMMVTGTDGFSRSTTCSAVAACSLVVPGAAEGVIDTVTVQTSGGSTRTVVLVF